MRRGIHRGWHATPRYGRREAQDLAHRERELLDVLDAEFSRAARRAGPRLACHPGCSDCCFGPFPVTRLDVRRLREGLGQLEARDPSRAASVRRRAREAVKALTAGYPGDRRSGRLRADASTLDRFFERHDGLPCPALDPSAGHCELYDQRPVGCRTYGPPLRFGDRNSPPCRLCLVGASSAEVEACRYEPDPDNIEGEILQAMGVAGDDEWETLIAFALAASR
jgi:Fe-S-cluster containining protein